MCTPGGPFSVVSIVILVFCAAADSLEVGFVNENGTAVTNTISSGASAVFPQGAFADVMQHIAASYYTCKHCIGILLLQA